MTSNTCEGTTRAGIRCRAFALRGQKCCAAHGGAPAEKVRAWRTLGGKRSRRRPPLPVSLESNSDYRRVLESALGDTLALRNTPSRNRVIGYVIGIALTVRHEGEFGERLDALQVAV